MPSDAGLRATGCALSGDEPQQISYGELAMSLEALKACKGPLIYVTDEDKVMQGWYERRWKAAAAEGRRRTLKGPRGATALTTEPHVTWHECAHGHTLDDGPS